MSPRMPVSFLTHPLSKWLEKTRFPLDQQQPQTVAMCQHQRDSRPESPQRRRVQELRGGSKDLEHQLWSLPHGSSCEQPLFPSKNCFFAYVNSSQDSASLIQIWLHINWIKVTFNHLFYDKKKKKTEQTTTLNQSKSLRFKEWRSFRHDRWPTQRSVLTVN